MSPARCLAFAGLSLWAGTQQAPETIIRTTTQMVQVRVAAYDSSGKPAAGLQRSDFQVFDNGKEQPIALFAAESGVASPLPGGGAPQAGPSRENLPTRDDTAIILLDWLNTSLADRVHAFDNLTRLLKTFQPSQKTAVYALTDSLRLVHNFTTDTGELLDAINDTGVETGDFRLLPAGAGIDPGLRGPGGKEIQLLQLDTRIHQAIDALALVADRLTRMPGRKSLIWLSDGFSMVVGPANVPGARPAEYTYGADIERLLAKLNRADIAVYSISAQGLKTQVSPSVPENAMFELSQRTGGTVFADRNDLDAGIRTALEDINISYTIGFNVAEGAVAGIHAIQVRATRTGLRLRYRESYVLDAPAAGKTRK